MEQGRPNQMQFYLITLESDAAMVGQAIRLHWGMIPNIPKDLRCRSTPKRGRKPFFDPAIFQERFFTIERVFGWEDKFRRLLLRFEPISQLLAIINLENLWFKSPVQQGIDYS
jgi:hypothetical protein